MVSDVLSPLQRIATTARGQKPDKLPVSVGNCNTFLCQYYGVSVQEYLENPKVTADITVRFIREFNIDYCLAGTGYILYGCGPELGPKWEFVGDNFPGCVEGVVKGPEDLDRLKVPDAPSGYFKNYLEIIRLTNDAIGDQVLLRAAVLGPFSVACFMRGIEEVMLDTKLAPDFYQAYMSRCVQLSKYFGWHILNTGLKAGYLNEVFLTPEMVGPPFFHQHIAPFDLQVQERLGPERVPNTLSAVMGKPDDPVSQKEGQYVFQAFYGTAESLDVVRKAVRYRIPGFPLSLAISGRALSDWSTEQILDFIKEGVDYLVKDEGLYPSIFWTSVQSESQAKAAQIAEKMRAVAEFRDAYAI